MAVTRRHGGQIGIAAAVVVASTAIGYFAAVAGGVPPVLAIVAIVTVCAVGIIGLTGWRWSKRRHMTVASGLGMVVVTPVSILMTGDVPFSVFVGVVFGALGFGLARAAREAHGVW